ncbi:dihydroorotate dehydrogenase electron transfer subunit [Aminipila butyrica]|uniref:Dihydroorotate dehydrogenase electron transfer subunit n=1 Tax=Aminipila butyrica TaxID=433296 RepID=A0A858BY53_9FIRM|nr:dihydroorotate dehydrogenase electron transfer subunit [Aminipila butyrica]QIB69644.1 dihydroorotate dehydrogenase electron transfer subunit [Aminipila butyrica]
MKKIICGKVACNEAIARDIYKMQIQSPELGQAKPGQFVNLYLADKSMLLPRPISICDIEEGCMTLVYKVVGKGTKALSAYKEQDDIRVSTPLGNGYFIEGEELEHHTCDYRGKKVALVGGGIGVPPMVLLAKRLQEQGAEVTAVVGFPEEAFLIQELKGFCQSVHIATDRGTIGFHGNVLELIQEKEILAQEYFACGPKVMLRALSQWCQQQQLSCQVSLEERMGCGYGACVGCTCKIKVVTEAGVEIQQKGVCKHGPVFFGEEVAWDA